MLKKTFIGLVGPAAAAESRRRMDTANIWAINTLSPAGRQSSACLRRHRGAYAGQRCFIIGNGPSLKDTDLRLIRSEHTFGLNRIYLIFEEMGFATTYIVSVNNHVLRQSGRDLAALPCTKFFSARSRHVIPVAADTSFLQSRNSLTFSKDPIRYGVSEGATVTFVALQLAYFMGYDEVILVGVDHSFSTSGPAHQLVESRGGDVDHFSPDYFGPGYQWQLPDLPASERAYSLARAAFEADGRRVLDATVNGALTIFPKVSYCEVVGSPTSRLTER
jgi:hypothetical protein